MKQRLRKLLFLLVKIIVTLAGAFGLVGLIERMPLDMPYSVYRLLQTIVTVAGHGELDNPDDMFGLAFVLYLLVSIIFVGALVIACNIAIRHYLAKRRSDA